MNICVYGASSNNIDKSYIIAMENLGCEMAKRGHTLVFGGGANGLMGAVARGMTKGGGKIVGISPKFFDVDGVLYDKCTEFIYTETMRERKQLLEDMSEGFIVMPGGPGTLDEYFETLCLRQIGQHNKPMAVFNVNGYFDSIIRMFEKAVNENFVPEKSLSLFFVSDNPQKITDYFENYVPDDFSPEFLKNIK